jgi:hypothetical protein
MKHSTPISALILLFPSLAAAREAPPILGSQRSASPPAAAAETDTSSASSAMPAAKLSRRGLYLHSELGAGYRSFRLVDSDSAFTGIGLSVSGLFGAALVPNLFLVGEVSLTNIVNPTVSSAGRSVDTKDVTAKLFGFGPGLVYYVMPANISLGASFLVTGATIEREDAVLAKSQLGYGGVARIGKEWWVGRSSAGVSAQVSLAGMKDSGENPDTLMAASYSLGLAMTF